MANTYTQLHVQLIFAVKYRLCLIDSSWKEELHKYATGIIQSNQHKVLQVNSMPDHIHILIGLRPHQAISSLVQNVKTETSKWIKDKKFCSHPFRWQEGFGAFSYSPMDVNNVIRYIQNQETHHKKERFLEEYDRLIELHEIQRDARYVFHLPE